MTTTDFYPPVLPEEQHSEYIHNLINEQRWLIEQIIIPKLPSFISTVKSILFYLILDKPFKLPITSNANDFLKGIITRKSFKIISLALQINKLSFFNNSNLFKIELNDEGEVELEQLKLILANLKFLLFQIYNLIQFIKLFKQEQSSQNVDIYKKLKNNLIFLKKFNQIYQNISSINELINNPIQSGLFPNSHLSPQAFEPPLNLDKLSIDLYLNSGEIFIELIFLKKIHIKPWCFINRCNISFNEFVIKRFVQTRNSNQTINQVIEYYLDEKNWPKFWNYNDKLSLGANLPEQALDTSSTASASSRASIASPKEAHHRRFHSNSSFSRESGDGSLVIQNNNNNNNSVDPSKFINTGSSLTSNHSGTNWLNKLINFQHSSETTNQLYLNRNIKFNNAIYWILKNLQVKISDPILIIINIKLDSMRNLIQNNLTNLKNLVINQDYLKSIILKEDLAFGNEGKLANATEKETSYNELVNQLFNNENEDLVNQEGSFDLLEFLQSNPENELDNLIASSVPSFSLATSSTLARKNSTSSSSNGRSSYEDLNNLDVNFDLLKAVMVDYEAFNRSLEEWDNDLVKDISTLVNSDSHPNASDTLSCCEFDVFDA